jgi:hypothetical protein
MAFAVLAGEQEAECRKIVRKVLLLDQREGRISKRDWEDLIAADSGKNVWRCVTNPRRMTASRYTNDENSETVHLKITKTTFPVSPLYGT